MPSKRVLIVEKDERLRDAVAASLRKEGYDPRSCGQGREGLERIEQETFDFILVDLQITDLDGIDFLRRVKSRNANAAILATAASADVGTAIEAMKNGAYDYLCKPYRVEEVILALKKAEERERLAEDKAGGRGGGKKEQQSYSNIVAKSRSMTEIFNTIDKIADYKTSCLLLGESGTGKELIARAIHYNGARAQRSFITVNCGAIPENLLESELFGHVKGSFTGAVRTKRGLFEEASQGTLFLDEIGELPLLLQVKLLRALQEEEIRRVGDIAPIKIDVRIITATVKDLAREVEAGTFREDLFYRLNVLPIFIPPLRKRKEDIPLLVEHFLGKVNKKLNAKVKDVEPAAMKAFMDHDWPGNVRELENTIERAMVLVTGDRITLDSLPANLRNSRGIPSSGPRFFEDELSIKKMGRRMEEELILRALDKSKGNRTKAAKLLEISHRALLYKIKDYRLEGKIRDLAAESAGQETAKSTKGSR
ncbi:MAG: sigma-54 dependent transcriptional regulator [Pseudomonadota bacterium]